MALGILEIEQPAQMLYQSENWTAAMASTRLRAHKYLIPSALYHLVPSSYLKKQGEVLGMS